MVQTQERRKEPAERTHSGVLKLEFGAEDSLQGAQILRDGRCRALPLAPANGSGRLICEDFECRPWSQVLTGREFTAGIGGQRQPPLAGWNNRRLSLPDRFIVVKKVRRPSSSSWPSVSPSTFFVASSSRSSWRHDFGPYIILSCIPIFNSVLAPFYRRLPQMPSLSCDGCHVYAGVDMFDSVGKTYLRKRKHGTWLARMNAKRSDVAGGSVKRSLAMATLPCRGPSPRPSALTLPPVAEDGDARDRPAERTSGSP